MSVDDYAFVVIYADHTCDRLVELRLTKLDIPFRTINDSKLDGRVFLIDGFDNYCLWRVSPDGVNYDTVSEYLFHDIPDEHFYLYMLDDASGNGAFDYTSGSALKHKNPYQIIPPKYTSVTFLVLGQDQLA